MMERDARALRRQSAVLCKQLVVDELLIQFLQADEILTESMAETIMVRDCWYMDQGQESQDTFWANTRFMVNDYYAVSIWQIWRNY